MPPDALTTDVEAEAGFRFVTSPGVLRLVVWGYWPSDVAVAFAKEANAIGQKLAPSAEFIMDAMKLKPQGIGGQEALRVLFRNLATVSLEKGTVAAKNILTQMQLARLIRECGLDERVRLGDISP